LWSPGGIVRSLFAIWVCAMAQASLCLGSNAIASGCGSHKSSSPGSSGPPICCSSRAS